MTLRELREKAGWTQITIAVELNVTQSAISVWDRGLNPPLKKYRPALCEAYRCTMEELEAAIEESRRRKP